MSSLQPVDICYSQDSINNVFDQRSRHCYKRIGETLDDICEGRCSVHDIPIISVKRIDDRWVTADNRRLWVFRQLYRLGKCNTVPVIVSYSIPSAKMTSENDGVDIEVRRGPGGRWYREPSVRSSTPVIKKNIPEPRILCNKSTGNFVSSSVSPTSFPTTGFVAMNGETESATDREITYDHVAVRIESENMTENIENISDQSSELEDKEVPKWRTYIKYALAGFGVIGFIIFML